MQHGGVAGGNVACKWVWHVGAGGTGGVGQATRWTSRGFGTVQRLLLLLLLVVWRQAFVPLLRQAGPQRGRIINVSSTVHAFALQARAGCAEGCSPRPHALPAVTDLRASLPVQAGHMALPFFSAYNASKAGLDILTDCLRYELQPQGVPVVLIKPGPVATPIW
jgi:NAD(P)-dependent dehydrogenase (short-subunit alcohol dehydrogenase family)